MCVFVCLHVCSDAAAVVVLLCLRTVYPPVSVLRFWGVGGACSRRAYRSVGIGQVFDCFDSLQEMATLLASSKTTKQQVLRSQQRATACAVLAKALRAEILFILHVSV